MTFSKCEISRFKATRMRRRTITSRMRWKKPYQPKHSWEQDRNRIRYTLKISEDIYFNVYGSSGINGWAWTLRSRRLMCNLMSSSSIYMYHTADEAAAHAVKSSMFFLAKLLLKGDLPKLDDFEDTK